MPVNAEERARRRLWQADMNTLTRAKEIEFERKLRDVNTKTACYASPVCGEPMVGRDEVGQRRCEKHGGRTDRVTVLYAEVDWSDGWDNGASLNVLLNRIPNIEEMRFRERAGLYYAELDGYVHFFAYGGPGDGFGGAVFPITMEDGSRKDLIGPWSSGAYAINTTEGLGHVLDVSITDSREVMARGHTFLGGHITAELGRQACELIPGVSLMWLGREGDTLVPVKGWQGRGKILGAAPVYLR